MPDVTPLIEIPNIADKTDHRADAQVGSMQRVDFSAWVEGCRLDANAHYQPPVTGGKTRLHHHRTKARSACTAPVASAHQVLLGKHLPGLATLQQRLAQRVQRGELAFDRLVVEAQEFTVTSEILNLNLHEETCA